MPKKKNRPPLDVSQLQSLPRLQTPPDAFVNAFPGIVKPTAVKRLDLFLRLGEFLLAEIRETGAFGVNAAPSNGTRRGYDYYGNDPARIFALATSLNRYSQNHGEIPDFLNPRTATQKLLVTKMFGEIPDGPPADKLMAELFVPRTVLPLLSPTRRVWISKSPVLPDNNVIPPGRYFLKTNFGAGNNIPVTFPLRDEDRPGLLEKVNYWFDRRHLHGFWAGEWWYHDIKPRVFLEESLVAEGQDIADWKFWVAAGRLQIVQVDQDRSTAHVQRIYDRDFNLLPHELYYRTDTAPDPRPDRYVDMVRVAEAVASKLEFARVDFFVRGLDIFLGEITLCPFGAKMRMRSQELEKSIGEGWVNTKLFPAEV